MRTFIKVSLQFLICLFVLFQGDVQARCCPGSFISVAGGGNFSLALKDTGIIWASGVNNNGQLGDGTTDVNFGVPNIVVTGPDRCSAFQNVTAIAAGTSHSLALRNDGTVWAWGDNAQGQLGIGSTVGFSTFPVPVKPVSGFTNIIAIAAGTYHSLALDSLGNVWAWGGNTAGQLGTGNNNPSSVPVLVKSVVGFTNIKAIAAGHRHSLAVDSLGNVWAWGLNNNGQLGIGTFGSGTNSNFPVKASITNVKAIAAGWMHSLALMNDNTVWAWGLNTSGQLGIGTITKAPVPYPTQTSISNVKAIAAGGFHSLALLNDNTVSDWGLNTSGQLGNGTTTNSGTPGPVGVPPPFGNAIAISGGFIHSLATKMDNTVWAWRDNSQGELGIGTMGGISKVPVQSKIK